MKKTSKLVKLHKNNLGIGLVETILAFGIGVIVITALVSLSVFTLRSSQNSKYLLQSSKLANEELEFVRAFKESQPTWQDFVDAVDPCETTNCSIQSLSVVAADEVIDPSPSVDLRRWFRASDPLGGSIDGDESLIRISVTVQWRVGNDIKTAHTYTDISNWRGE